MTAAFTEFQTFGEASLTEALDEAKKFCRAMASADKPGYWLVLLGPSGTGKTMLARKIKSFMLRHLDGLLDEAQTIYGDGGEAKERHYRKGGFRSWNLVLDEMLGGDFSGILQLCRDWFVALDDIGAEYGGNRELSVAKLYQILNQRAGKFTVLTANYDLGTIAKKLDARIASRLIRHGSIVVDVQAKDFNLR